MNLSLQKALINDVNFRFFGVDLDRLYASSGKLLSEKVVEMYGKSKSFSIICGLGGNASDGLSLAINLTKLNLQVSVYIIGRVSYSGSTIFKKLYTELDELKDNYNALKIKQDCYADDIEQSDINIEAMVGTGLDGLKLNKRFQDCINRISHFKSILVAIDVPAPSYTPDLVISLNYPKIDNAITIEIPESKDVTYLCGPGEVKFLFNPKSKTHKLKNGKVLYVCSTTDTNDLEKISKTAKSYACDLYIYNFNSTLKEHKGLNFISDLEFEKYYADVDSVLIGDIEESSVINTNFVKYIINTDKSKKLVLTWHILDILDSFAYLEELKDSILIMNRSTVDNALKYYGISERSLSQVTQTNIFFAGFQNTLYSKDGEYKINVNPKLANEVSLKTLSNIASVLLSKNDPWLTLKSSVFLFEVAQKLSLENKLSLEENLKEAIDLCKDF